jgi:hypothetical protein
MERWIGDGMYICKSECRPIDNSWYGGLDEYIVKWLGN